MKTTRSQIRAALAVAAICVVGGAQAQITPVGNWHSIDDKTGEIKSQIQISESDGVVEIVSGLAAGARVVRSNLGSLRDGAPAKILEGR